MARSSRKNNTKNSKNNKKSQANSVKNKQSNYEESISKMKYEIANEFGVNLGAKSSSRENGIVGGEITKRLVNKALKRSKANNK